MTTIVTVQDGPTPQARPGWLRPAVVDRIEQVVIVVLWVFLFYRVYESGNSYAPLLLLSETAVVVFTVFRRPTTKVSMRLGDWLLAATATYAGLLAGLLAVSGTPLLAVLAPVGVALTIGGNVIQAWAKLVLRRSFGIAPANRGIKISGPYRLVRHPMYAGYALVHIGVLMVMFSPVVLVVYVISWWAQILRLLAEERLLAEDPEYAAYMAIVKWRLLPGVF